MNLFVVWIGVFAVGLVLVVVVFVVVSFVCLLSCVSLFVLFCWCVLVVCVLCVCSFVVCWVWVRFYVRFVVVVWMLLFGVCMCGVFDVLVCLDVFVVGGVLLLC